jgi:hypothetical protein
MANTFADYLCLLDNEVILSPSKRFEFDAPSDMAVNLFTRSPVLMFLVRSNGTGGSLTLRVELNGRQALGVDRPIAVEVAARSYIEVVNRELFNPGVKNTFQFEAIGVNDTAEIVISDVVIWYQRDV